MRRHDLHGLLCPADTDAVCPGGPNGSKSFSVPRRPSPLRVPIQACPPCTRDSDSTSRGPQNNVRPIGSMGLLPVPTAASRERLTETATARPKRCASVLSRPNRGTSLRCGGREAARPPMRFGQWHSNSARKRARARGFPGQGLSATMPPPPTKPDAAPNGGFLTSRE